MNVFTLACAASARRLKGRESHVQASAFVVLPEKYEADCPDCVALGKECEDEKFFESSVDWE